MCDFVVNLGDFSKNTSKQPHFDTWQEIEGKSHSDLVETPQVKRPTHSLNNTKVIQNFREPF